MSGVTSSDDSRVEITELLDEFYGEPIGYAQLGVFEAVSEVPPPYDLLLDHHKHMTVTVEKYYDQTVDVQVHRCQRQADWYAREITLVTSQSQRIVQYGIVRLDTTKLDTEVWQQIESQQIPLGRVLIEHKVMREVELHGLWRVRVGPSLAGLMHVKIGDVLYGRTALIYCDGAPAIELLEIVAMVPSAEPS